MVRESCIDLVSGELPKQLDIAKVAVDRLGILSAEIYQFLPFFSLLHSSPWQRWTGRICTYPDILVQPYLLECRLKKGFKKVFWMEK